MITTTFREGEQRNRALSIYTAFGASGFSSGLILGGLMTEVGWRWTFLLPVPIAAGIVLRRPQAVPTGQRPTGTPTPQLRRARCADQHAQRCCCSSTRSPRAPRDRLGLAPHARLVRRWSLVLIAAFIVTERRVKHPLLRLGIFRNRSVVSSNVVAMTVFGAYSAFQFIVTLYMQSLLHWSPLAMAMALLPLGVIVAFGGSRVGGLVNRVGAPRVVLIGLLSFVIGYVLFLRIGEHPNYATTILPSMLLLGIGFALAFPALNIQATNGVSDSEQGLASGLVQTAFQVGGAIALAVVTAVLNAATPHTTAEVVASYHPALAVVTGVALLGLIATVAISGLRKPAAEVAPALKPEFAEV